MSIQHVLVKRTKDCTWPKSSKGHSRASRLREMRKIRGKGTIHVSCTSRGIIEVKGEGQVSSGVEAKVVQKLRSTMICWLSFELA